MSVTPTIPSNPPHLKEPIYPFRLPKTSYTLTRDHIPIFKGYKEGPGLQKCQVLGLLQA